MVCRAAEKARTVLPKGGFGLALCSEGSELAGGLFIAKHRESLLSRTPFTAQQPGKQCIAV